jgi:hypothetical protein
VVNEHFSFWRDRICSGKYIFGVAGSFQVQSPNIKHAPGILIFPLHVFFLTKHYVINVIRIFFYPDVFFICS